MAAALAIGKGHDTLQVAVAYLCHGVPLSRREAPPHCPASTVSFKPIALVTATRVDRRGLPWADRAR